MVSALRRTHGPDALTSYTGKGRAHSENSSRHHRYRQLFRRELWLGFVSLSGQHGQLPDPAFDRNFAAFWMSKIPENTRRNRQRYGKTVRGWPLDELLGCVIAYFRT